MTREEVLGTTRHFMMLDEQANPRAIVGRAQPMSRELMLQTLNTNHPRWQQLPGMKKEVEDIITEALKRHNMT